MANNKGVEKLRAALLLLVFSAVAGILTAGLGIPQLLVATTMVNSTATSWNNVALDLITPPQPQASKVYMADGSLLTTFSDQYREYVTIDNIAPVMQQAQVAIEDKRYYQHGAIDVIGMIRAGLGHLTGETDRGASTITQQYVKMVRVQIASDDGDQQALKAATEQTLARKIIEMRYAMALEKQLTKDQILERYLNIAYYGDSAYGVEAAATHYFGVSAKDLNLPQAAMLAGLVQSPGSTDPVHNPDAAVARRNVVLSTMAESDVADITAQQAKDAQAVPWDPNAVVPFTKNCPASRYPFLCDYVYNTLLGDGMSSLGSTSDDREQQVLRGGLTIQTLIDPAVQDEVQAAVSSLIDPRDPVIGVMAIVQPGTGKILAMAQSRYTEGDGDGQTWYNYAIGKYMTGGSDGFQSGSTFKAFTLANAISQGVPFNTMYTAKSPISLPINSFSSCSGQVVSNQSYKVQNEGNQSYGNITLLQAAANSVNTYFVQLERDIGICGGVKMAQAAGLQEASSSGGGYDLIKNFNADQHPSFTLGVDNVAPLDMAAAYATFAAGGVHCDPIILASVKNAAGDDFAVPDGNCQQTIEPYVAAGVSAVLQGVMSGGTGRPAALTGGYPQAGKTGTTDSRQALAFAGYTPNVAGFAIIGEDNPQSDFWSGKSMGIYNYRLPYSGTYLGGTGGGDAGRIWHAAMQPIVNTTPATPFPAFVAQNRGFSSPNTVAPAPTPTDSAQPPA